MEIDQRQKAEEAQDEEAQIQEADEEDKDFKKETRAWIEIQVGQGLGHSKTT